MPTFDNSREIYDRISCHIVLVYNIINFHLVILFNCLFFTFDVMLQKTDSIKRDSMFDPHRDKLKRTSDLLFNSPSLLLTAHKFPESSSNISNKNCMQN